MRLTLSFGSVVVEDAAAMTREWEIERTTVYGRILQQRRSLMRSDRPECGHWSVLDGVAWAVQRYLMACSF
jgi:hypothetical protein